MMTRRQALHRLGRLAAAQGAALTASPWPAHGAAAEPLRFAELYAGGGPLGLRFAERALALRGRAVAVRGFLAPPLKPEAHFFVLSARPVALCPFCQSDADWPHDIIVIYPRSGAEFRVRRGRPAGGDRGPGAGLEARRRDGLREPGEAGRGRRPTGLVAIPPRPWACPSTPRDLSLAYRQAGQAPVEVLTIARLACAAGETVGVDRPLGFREDLAAGRAHRNRAADERPRHLGRRGRHSPPGGRPRPLAAASGRTRLPGASTSSRAFPR